MNGLTFSRATKAGAPYLTTFLLGDVGNLTALSPYPIEVCQVSHISPKTDEIWGTHLGGSGKVK